jgi:hypothetical protein
MFDRPAWEAAYAQVHGSVAAAMACWVNQGPGEDESRGQALKAIWKEKRKAEQAATLAPPEGDASTPSRLAPKRDRRPRIKADKSLDPRSIAVKNEGAVHDKKR